MFACIKYRNLREHDEVKKKSKRNNNNNKPAKYTQYNKNNNNNNGVYNMKLLPLSLIKVMCARSSTQTSTSSCMMHASAWQRHHQRHAQNFCIQLKRGAGSIFLLLWAMHGWFCSSSSFIQMLLMILITYLY